jgi:hypothetical protein
MQTNPPKQWSSILLTIYSGMMVLLLIGTACILFLSGVSDNSKAQLLILEFSLFALCALLIPMGYLSIQRLLGKPGEPAILKKMPFQEIFLWTVFWMVTVFGGERLLTLEVGWIWLAGLPVYLVAVITPIFLLIRVGLGGVPLGSKQRVWSIFGVGLVVGPVLILIAEICIGFFSILAGVIYLVTNPLLSPKLLSFYNQLSRTDTIEAAQKLLLPYLLNPWIIVILFLFISGIVPVVEEILKPAGIWLAVNKKMKPGDGFVMGILSGAGYALFETLASAINVGDGWGILLVGRAGTDLLHILNTGLMGWAMVSAWNIKGVIKLSGIYILTILIHGIWNGLSIASGIGNLISGVEINKPWIGWLSLIGSGGLIFLVVLMFVSLVLINNRLQPTAAEKI